MHTDVTAAKREARRRSRTDKRPLQTHLDEIAREAGRLHWSDFLTHPGPRIENPLDRLMRESMEDGYEGIEIDVGEHVPFNLGPILIKAFREVEGECRIDLWKLGWEDAMYIAPMLRRRFERPNHNAAFDVDCNGTKAFLYNHMDVQMAFVTEGRSRCWNEVHGMSPQDAFARAGRVKGYWRDRVGRSIAEIVRDKAMHRRHVRNLERIVAAPAAPPVRFDPFCRSVTPVIHPDIDRAHFAAVADVVLPEGPDAEDQRFVFVEVAMGMRRLDARLDWSDRTPGLPDFSAGVRSMLADITEGRVPERLSHLDSGRLTSLINQTSTKMLRFSTGPLARATDGAGERNRMIKARMEWEHGMWLDFVRSNPGVSSNDPAFHAWMAEADTRPDAPPRPDRWG